MAQGDDIQDLQERTSALEAMVRKAGAGVASGLCNAEMPHAEMVFMRGPNTYLCRCGQSYRKDGQGGLRAE